VGDILFGWIGSTMKPMTGEHKPCVELFTFNGCQRALVDYDCTLEEARRFAATFRRTIERLPGSASGALNTYWARSQDTPRVSLPRSPKSWGGQGWAASKYEGRSLFVAAPIAVRIPEEHLQAYLAHELAHALCFAVAEPSHLQGPGIRPEWLVWQLMAAWNIDQPAAELWTYQYVDDTGEVPTIRSEPLDEEKQRERIRGQRQRLLDLLQDRSIPMQLRAWLPE
jgi:hypothetical protein